MLGALTFSTNWLEITAGTSYFDQTAPQLFMNFWSLAVEEQFYLLWPLLTLALLAVSSRMRVGVAVAVGMASSLLMAVLFAPGTDATRVYYGTDTHVMGLMAGAALAFAWASPQPGVVGGAVALGAVRVVCRAPRSRGPARRDGLPRRAVDADLPRRHRGWRRWRRPSSSWVSSSGAPAA